MKAEAPAVKPTCKPKNDSSGTKSTVVPGTPSPIKLVEEQPDTDSQLPEAELQDSVVLGILEHAEQVLDALAKQPWAGIKSPDVVVGRIQSIMKSGENALKAGPVEDSGGVIHQIVQGPGPQGWRTGLTAPPDLRTFSCSAAVCPADRSA